MYDNLEKQRAKFIYGILEKQFRNTYNKAARKKGITGENFLVMLEMRLDSIVYRMGFATTRREARQPSKIGRASCRERV